MGCVLTYSFENDLFGSSKLPSLSVKKSVEKIELTGWIAGRCGDYIIIRTYDSMLKLRIGNGKAEQLAKLPLETLVRIYGVVSGDQLIVYMYDKLVEPVEERTIDYLEASEWDPVTYAKYSVWGVRHPRYRYTVMLQFHLLRYMREYLYKNKFIELLSPMISVSSDPDLRGARKLKTRFYGVEYELTSSVIMYKQLSVAVFKKIFYVARNIREEPVENIDTGRHLAEFTQLDLEYGLAGMDRVIEIAERMLKFVSKRIADRYNELITEKIGLRREPVVFKPPFPRITYDEAIKLASRLGYEVKWGHELSFEAEKALAEYFETPIWITNHPVVSRGFYYLPCEDDPRYNMDFNLILPEGYGEVIDGGSREYRYKQLVERIKKLDEPLEKYKWFLDLVKQGAIIPSSGWGLGLERLTRYLAGHRHIVYASMYPKPPGLTGTP